MAGAPTVFISYSQNDAASLDIVAQLEGGLSSAGFRVLRDVDIDAGTAWSDELWRWLMECSAAVVVVTEAAVRSQWCQREWSVLAARNSHSELPVVPVLVGSRKVEANVLDRLQAVQADAAVVKNVVKRLAKAAVSAPTRDDYLAAHSAWLRWQFRSARVLGREPYALSDVYVETECGVLSWGELAGDRAMDPFSSEYGGRKPLVDTVLNRFADPAFRDLIVVQGPAGSGKSAFSLRLANRLLQEGLSPILVRFRDLRLSSYGHVDELLQDGVRVAPAGEHPPGPAEPLFGATQLAETSRFRGTEVCKTVVILDGWDEVVVTGSIRFKEQLDEWLPRLRQYFTDRPGPPVRLLLTGRPSPLVDRSGLLRRDTLVLTIRPIRPDQLRDYGTRISRRLGPSDWTLDLQRCEEAFARYQAWYEESDDGRADVLGSPLLALLAFRTIAAWPGLAHDLFERPTALYNALIEITVAHAGRADEGPQGTVHRGGRSLRRLLQRVATVITCQGGESVSFEELRLRLEDDDALADWAEQATHDNTLHELVVNFYFKGHRELGCEFLHKSFREYLFAEAIVATLESIAGAERGPLPPTGRHWSQDFPSDDPRYTVSRSLAGLLAPQWLTPEVRNHAFWLVEKAVAGNRGRWIWIRDVLNDVYGWWGEGVHLRMHPERRRGRTQWHSPMATDLIDDDLPLDGRQPPSSQSIGAQDAHFGDGLIQLTAFVHYLLMDAPMTGPSRDCQVGESGNVRFRPFCHEARNLISRLGMIPQRPEGHALQGAYLRGVDLSGEDLTACELSRCDLREADLRKVNGAGIILTDADLSGADLRSADLSLARLEGTRFVGSKVGGAMLTFALATNADFTNADLSHATLTGARINSATLDHANFAGAGLTEANLAASSFRHASLQSTTLLKADLTNADLTDADLRGARLRGVRANSVSLIRADLSNARLEEADFRGADLTDTVICDVELDVADLRGAVVTSPQQLAQPTHHGAAADSAGEAPSSE